MKRTALKRKTPMRRKMPFRKAVKPSQSGNTAFYPEGHGHGQAPEHPHRVRMPGVDIDAVHHRVKARMMTEAPARAPMPKFAYIRDERIRDLCRELPCMSCFGSNGVTWAHSNWAIHGHGRGIKASDQYIAALCRDCHRELDQGTRMTEERRQSLWWVAHTQTVAWLVSIGNWPAGVPVPDIEHYPW